MERIYLRTTLDELELPIAVAGSVSELSRLTGTSEGTIRSSISHHNRGWHRILVEEEDEDNDISAGD